MNIRITFALIGVLILVIIVGVLVTVNRGRSTPTQVSPPAGAIYQVPEDSLRTITITYKDARVFFVRDAQGTWHFDTTDGEVVNQTRWGGIPLLLSGPQYQRLLLGNPTDLTPYGLQTPQTVVNLTLTGNLKTNFKIGDLTPNGDNYYVQASDEPTIYLVDKSFPDVFQRLVDEPPHQPTPTPVPTPEAPATPTS